VCSLLDMQVRDGESVLSKYSLKANDAILVEDKQADIYDYIRKEFEIVYVACACLLQPRHTRRSFVT
jgi:adenosine kinase